MRRVLPYVLGAAAAIGIALSTTACGSYAAANDYNAPTPQGKVVPHWERFETPGNFPSVVFACWKGDGYYADQDSYSSMQIVANDPACK